jgi:dCTP deaminase
MTTFVDYHIEDLAGRGMISPFRAEQLNPASYDVRLGNEILVEGRIEGPIDMRQRWQRISIEELPYRMDPGEFVLAVTEEIISLPNYVEGIFQLKSSRGREGYEHALAGYIDPGFSGRITLELSNLNRYHSLELKMGMLIGQIRFAQTYGVPKKPYNETGHYNNDMTVQPSKVLAIQEYEEK